MGCYLQKKRLKYQIYTWSQGSFRHESVVIGCYNDHDQDIDNKIEINHKHGFITMELKVDIEQEKVFPDTKFFTRKEAINFITKGKWQLETDINLKTTMVQLIDFVLNLIKNHGKYSHGFNNCKIFVQGFVQGCRHPNGFGIRPMNRQMADAFCDAFVLGGGSIGWIVGRKIGKYVGYECSLSKLGMVYGILLGMEWGIAAGLRCGNIGRLKNNNNYEKVYIKLGDENNENDSGDESSEELLNPQFCLFKLTKIIFVGIVKSDDHGGCNPNGYGTCTYWAVSHVTGDTRSDSNKDQ